MPAAGGTGVSGYWGSDWSQSGDIGPPKPVVSATGASGVWVASHVHVICVCVCLGHVLSLATGWTCKSESSRHIHYCGMETPGHRVLWAGLQQLGRRNSQATRCWRWRLLLTSLNTLCDYFHLPIFCLSRNKFTTFYIVQIFNFCFCRNIFIINNLLCYGTVQGPVRVMVNGNCSGSEDASYVTLPKTKCCSHSVIRRKLLPWQCIQAWIYLHIGSDKKKKKKRRNLLWVWHR